MLIRVPEPRDTPARVEIARANVSYSMVDAALIERLDANALPEERALRLVAESGGRVIGSASASLNRFAPPGTAEVVLGVHPDHRGRGAGSALWERVAAHLDAVGATITRVSAHDDASAAFAARRGFDSGRVLRVSAVDPREVPEPVLPDGVELRSMADEAGMRAAYDVDTHISAEVPSPVPRARLSYEAWRERNLGAGVMDRDCSLVAFLDGEPVALTIVNVMAPRAINSIAGTHPSHRRKGLARLVKAASLRVAAAKGVTSVATLNDEENTAMLAVNAGLGYRVIGVRHDLARRS